MKQEIEIHGETFKITSTGGPVGPSLKLESDSFVITLRQLEILSLCSQGYSRREVADILHIKYHSVELLIDNMRQKNLEKRGERPSFTEMTVGAWNRGLLSPCSISGLKYYLAQESQE